MTDLGIQAAQDVPETISGATPFQFAISWRSLTQPKRPSTALPTGSGLIAGRALAVETQMNPFEAVRPLVNAPDTRVPSSEEPTSLVSAPSVTPAFDNSSLRKWAALVGLALLIVTFALAAMRRPGKASSQPNQTPVQTIQMGGTGWISEWVTDRIGSDQGRQSSQYKDSSLFMIPEC
jgi:hypothetical protein